MYISGTALPVIIFVNVVEYRCIGDVFIFLRPLLGLLVEIQIFKSSRTPVDIERSFDIFV